MESKILFLLKDKQHHFNYLHKYWYNLKSFVHGLHAIYRLLYKVLYVYGSDGMCTKLKCHNLVYGPRTIAHNLLLFEELMKFTQIQVSIIGCIVCFKSDVHLQDTISWIFFCLVKFLDNIIWQDNCRQNMFQNGQPVQLNFI